MQSFIIRGGLAAAAVIAIAAGTTPKLHAQQAVAVSANPELAAQGEWDETTTYAIDDIVTARGSTWRSKRNNNVNKVPGQTQPSTATSWELFARGFNPAGAWSNAVKYQPDDLVTHNGQTYRAKITNLNKPPTNTNNWELLAAKGANGAPGAQGLQGDQGVQGPPGPNTGIGAGTQGAPSISFTGDPDTGIFRPADGKIALVENGQLFLHSTGTFNTGVGPRALSGGNTGAGNTAVGSDALLSNTSGSSNTAVGLAALLNNITGQNNTAIGTNALRDNTSSGNTAVGRDALAQNTNAGGNTAVGDRALELNAGLRNTAVGGSALRSNQGADNIALGHQALTANIFGFANIAMGTNALSVNVGGGDNIALGSQALTDNIGGGRNIAFGTNTLAQNTDGDENIALGTSALVLNTTGNNNIALGVNAGSNANGSSNSIFIGTSGSTLDNATIKIGTQGTQTTTFIAGIASVQAGDAAVFVDSTTGQLGIGAAPSSRRLKHDIENMADSSGLLAKLRPVTFRYNQARSDGSHPLQYGLIAEEVAELIPDLALFDKEGQPNGVKYHLLPAFLLAGYQAQQNTIAALIERDRLQAEELRQQAQLNASLEARLRGLETLLPQTKAAAWQ
jgi:hypothetical protein